jgi:hypothetical protein
MFSEKGKQIHRAKQPTQIRRRTNLERSTTTRVLEEGTKGSFDYRGVF